MFPLAKRDLLKFKEKLRAVGGDEIALSFQAKFCCFFIPLVCHINCTFPVLAFPTACRQKLVNIILSLSFLVVERRGGLNTMTLLGPFFYPLCLK